MRHGSLFSGIGGFDLAAQRMGWENVFHCEWNEFGKRVLQYYWPKAISYEDIAKTDFTVHRGAIDILTGGFPCQPYSLAGKRKGKEDDRHLWPEMLRAIREISPRWVVGENVFGLINWNGGLVFNEVQTDLEAEGYEVFPYVLPACAVNAPHRRDRVWFVAYCNTQQRERQTRGFQPKSFDGSKQNASNPNSNGQHRSNSEHEVNAGEGRINAQRDIEQMGEYATNANSKRLERWKAFRYAKNRKWENCEAKQFRPFYKCSNWQNFPTQSPICSGDDGLPTKLDGITFPKWRNESIKAYGNAIVPQVALQIFKAIEAHETTILRPRRVFE